MLSNAVIADEIPYLIRTTSFPALGERYEGKVRDCYQQADILILIATDRLSAFDRVITAVPFKGQVLTRLAEIWFHKTSHIIENHLIDVPDPNVMVVRSCEIVPIEVVVRGFLTGSAWRDYEKGNPVSGIVLPPNLRHGERLETPILTPSTKAEKGSHDMPISEEEIVHSKLVSPVIWDEIREKALALFMLGQKEAAKNGLLLVDTKYEFGLHGDSLILADEIHTLDSSRYWKMSSYESCLTAGAPFEMLDKEPIRQWLLAQGFQGDGTIPSISDAYLFEICRHYTDSFGEISGTPFVPECRGGLARITRNLKSYFRNTA